jgi:hypothetical protein
MRLFAVTEAYYLNAEGDMVNISGVPEHGYKYFGEYTGIWPYVAASKAFTGLQKHMHKFYRGGKWFRDYDPDQPPIIIFTIEDVETNIGTRYRGERVAAHQGNRQVVSSSGRVRNYRWENVITKLH